MISKRIAKWVFVGLISGVLLGNHRPARAEPPAIGFELYSWQVGTRWNFAVLEGTPKQRSRDEIRSAKNRLRNLTYLKGRVATLPSGELLYWREDKAHGFRLPPKELIREIDQFAANANIKLLLPGQDPDAKTLEQLQTEVQHLVDD